LPRHDKKALPYDLTLMDWKMPGMDGVETVRQLQGRHLNKTPPVIMVTALWARRCAVASAQERGVHLRRCADQAGDAVDPAGGALARRCTKA
jgi:two-component system sensor histidine kinase/response regulator